MQPKVSYEESILELKSGPLEHKEEYLKAIMKEFADLCRNECFSLEVIPEERSPISTKIVLKTKRKGDGSFDKYKARCVVRGFLATIGLDFYATYSPASSMTTARPEDVGSQFIIFIRSNLGTKIGAVVAYYCSTAVNAI